MKAWSSSRMPACRLKMLTVISLLLHRCSEFPGPLASITIVTERGCRTPIDSRIPCQKLKQSGCSLPIYVQPSSLLAAGN